MGSEAYLSPSESEQDPKKITIQQLDTEQGFTIPAGQFAFLLTEERVTVPLGAIGFISMKSGIKLRGLVNVSGFHVDPGYSGHLIFAVFNAGPKLIHLRRGDDCFLIWYADLDNEKSQMGKAAGTGFRSITTDIVTKISGEVMSFDGLNAKIKDLKEDYDKRIHDIERDNGIIKMVGMLVVGILGTAMIVPLAKNVWDRWSLTSQSPSVAPTTSPSSAGPAPPAPQPPSEAPPTSPPSVAPPPAAPQPPSEAPPTSPPSVAPPPTATPNQPLSK
jgi:dCTP deaminase